MRAKAKVQAVSEGQELALGPPWIETIRLAKDRIVSVRRGNPEEDLGAGRDCDVRPSYVLRREAREDRCWTFQRSDSWTMAGTSSGSSWIDA